MPLSRAWGGPFSLRWPNSWRFRLFWRLSEALRVVKEGGDMGGHSGAPSHRAPLGLASRPPVGLKISYGFQVAVPAPRACPPAAEMPLGPL